ncbi:MAG TPA: transporter substrate-binding domain-containing protein [Rhodocyclaceae bacterium]|nr:transporter substrate-binding domain-containing protein [Rhodocyclaceae bacterium]
MFKHKSEKLVASASLLAMSLLGSSVATAQSITVYYNPRPPYLVMQEGFLTGLTGSPAVAAFKAAGQTIAIKEMPATRQLEMIKANAGQECGVGWFKNPEREGFAKFSKPIYQDEPQVALTAASNKKLKNGDPIETVLQNKDLTLLVKQSYSYGKALDVLIEKHQPRRNSVTVENIQMFKMIQSERADYMFTAPEEAAVTIAAAGFQSGDFNLIKPGNMPKGELRHIMCSKSVPDDVMAKLNAAIK